jgi:hypothetical protein
VNPTTPQIVLQAAQRSALPAAGEKKAWKRKTSEVQKKFKKRGDSHQSGARCVRRLSLGIAFIVCQKHFYLGLHLFAIRDTWPNSIDSYLVNESRAILFDFCLKLLAFFEINPAQLPAWVDKSVARGIPTLCHIPIMYLRSLISCGKTLYKGRHHPPSLYYLKFIWIESTI